MAKLIVPTDYATLEAAVAAASNNDVIILEDGVHTTFLSEIDKDLIIRSRHRGGATLRLEESPLLKESTVNTFRGIVFDSSPGGVPVFTTEQEAVTSFVECTFIGPYGLGLFTASNIELFVYRCLFATDQEPFEGIGDGCEFRSCIFSGCDLGSSTLATSTGDADFINCTFVGLTTTADYITSTGYIIVNCVFDRNECAVRVLQNEFVDNCCIFNTVGGVNFSSMPAGSIERDPRLLPNHAPDLDSPLRNRGFTNTDRFVGFDRRVNQNDIGAIACGKPVFAFGMRHPDIDLTSVDYGADTLGPFTKDMYAGPDLTEYICYEIGDLSGHKNVLFSVRDDGRYHVFITQSGSTMLPLVFSDRLSTIMGSGTVSGAFVTFGLDPYLYLSPTLADEEPIADIHSGHTERFNTGYVSGRKIPANSNKKELQFSFVSPAFKFSDRSTFKIDKLFSGVPARVYRYFPLVIDQWSYDNPLGHHEAAHVSDSQKQHTWYDSVMRRFEHSITLWNL